MACVTRLRLAILTHWEGDQYELAQRCCLDPSLVAKYARGHQRMQGDHRAILAHVLGVGPPEIDGWLEGPDVWESVKILSGWSISA